MIHRYPAKVKPSTWADPQRPTSRSVDVLAPEGYGEIIGGSQRMASYELLLQRIHEHGLPKKLSSGI
jgi:asparaginyl-tRNA synthetase